MSHLILGILVLLIGLIISGVAAYVSVTGMVIIFAATPITCYITFGALEAGKLIAAQWLHSNWKNPLATRKHKGYMLVAVAVLMVVTAFGIYGFLSKGHLEQEAPIEGLALQVAQKEQSIKMIESTNTRLQQKLDQLDANISSFLKGDKAERANSVRNRQKSERADIEKQINENNAKIKTINDELLPIKIETSQVTAKLGPIKYVAELFGMTDTGAAVRMLILMVMFAFDPLAIALLLGAVISFETYALIRRKNAPNSDAVEASPTMVNTNTAQSAPPSEEPAKSSSSDDQVQSNVEEESTKSESQATLVELDMPHDEDLFPKANITPQVPDFADELELVPMESKPEIVTADVATKPSKKKKTRQRKAKQDDVLAQEAKAAYDSAVSMVAKTYTNEPLIKTPVVAPLPLTDAAQLVEILENNPHLLENVIDVVKDEKAVVQVPDSEKLQAEPKQAHTNVSQAELDANLRSPTTWLSKPRTPRNK